MTEVVGAAMSVLTPAMCALWSCDVQPADVLASRPVDPPPRMDGGPLDATLDAAEASEEAQAPDAARELTCDGVDDAGNGVIDDVDPDVDPTCCLALGVVGNIDAPSTSTFRAWLAQRSTRLVALGNDVIEDAVLAPLHVLLIGNLASARPYDAAEIAAVEGWVQRGGGVFALTGYTADDNAEVNALLAPYGIQFGSRLLIVNPLANASWPVTTWHAHRISSGISRVGVVSAYEVQGAGAPVAEGNDVLAGPVVMMRAREHGAGRVLAWGDEWITFDSEWAEAANYQVPALWENALTWLGPERCRMPSL